MSDGVNELLAKLDIVQVISKYIALKGRGDSYLGLCPFHHEKTPSFSVSQSKQVYHCFGCKESGNAISFIKKIENCDFVDSINILCKDAGIEIPEFKFEKKDNNSFLQRDKLFKLLRDAAIQYHYNLKLDKGIMALEYLQSRGLSQDTVIKFGIGVSIDNKSILNHLYRKGYSFEEMVQAGIANKSQLSIKENSTQTIDFVNQDIGINTDNIDNYYDVFNGRLMIPIINNTNSVIGFGARDLSGRKDVAKYKNSRQSQIFDKSNTVFSINNLKKIKKTKGFVSYAILVEGYFDVISLYASGYEMAVACMGTALTLKQARQIKNYTDNIYVSFDGDEAGNMATQKSLEILSQVGLVVRVLDLPQGVDPDSFIKEKGKVAYQSLIEDADTLPAFKLKTLFKSIDINDTAQRTKFALDGCRVVASLDDVIQQEEYRHMLSRLSGYSIEILKSQEEQLEQPILANETSNKDLQNNRESLLNKAIDFVLASLVQQMEWADYTVDIFDYLPTDLHRLVYTESLNNFKYNLNNSSISALYSQLDESECSKLSYWLNYEFIKIDNKIEFDNYVNQIKIKYLENEREKLLKLNGETNDSNLLIQIGEISKKIIGIKKLNSN
ncbi:MAG: DNA primase [Firmicutes bacterium]|nr:DNA primase [Bacillota bacterium]MCL1953439.1 DNA primase [Bacillota bacterium]